VGCDRSPVLEPGEHDLDPVVALLSALAVLMGLHRSFRSGMHGVIALRFKPFLNQSAVKLQSRTAIADIQFHSSV
jgi:hypothetical protein